MESKHFTRGNPGKTLPHFVSSPPVGENYSFLQVVAFFSKICPPVKGMEETMKVLVQRFAGNLQNNYKIASRKKSC